MNEYEILNNSAKPKVACGDSDFEADGFRYLKMKEERLKKKPLFTFRIRSMISLTSDLKPCDLLGYYLSNSLAGE